MIACEPNWGLVTDNYKEPNNFKDLFALLLPADPKGNSKERTILKWRHKEFYKEKNIIPYILYGMKKSFELPKYDNDEMFTLLRIVRLCQEIGWYKQAYDFMIKKELTTFIKTSIDYEQWDVFTQALAWNYLIIKKHVIGLEEEDHLIWERIKFNPECIELYGPLLSHKEMLEFMFLYVCKQAKHISKDKLNENIMELSIYCNDYIHEIYSLNLLLKYRKCTEFLSYYQPSPIVLACHRAVSAQIFDHLNPVKTIHIDDYLFEIKEMLRYINYQFLKKYKVFIGKLLSYIPFCRTINTLHHVYYFEEIMYICKGVGYKEEMLRDYVFIQLPECFSEFIKIFLKYKQYPVIHQILFYWCDHEQRMAIEETYDLNSIYEKFACG
ncbi:DUF3965 domain-containing protein [Bacillus mycoides]|uniref:DUF3965 domain-containing protein n=2 Tax=Bacillus cereus TaxID=1396 RepID=R8Q8I8_BACCE|nr:MULTISPECIES: DUF3965 domain-containing protein [Bacillus cereus group]EEL02849.1 hypothetical protein bcere0014_56060 [Bacillus cereus BDRD-ST196]AIW87867.1 hypothetical protein bwei_5324 [Bacillus mycoides]EOO71775.1 hypothetical protein IIC_04291 [Bacillus cereus VD021]EOP67416.1 hypothetical protein IIQ_05369 [Bacillus cereus VD118]MBJ8095366.1 DUF3965 domain-containing protein [Bacillus cereus]